MIWGAFFTEYLFLGLFALFNLNDDQFTGFWLHNSLPVFKMDAIKGVGIELNCRKSFSL